VPVAAELLQFVMLGRSARHAHLLGFGRSGRPDCYTSLELGQFEQTPPPFLPLLKDV
jgi:hypothetical protein